GSTVVPVNQSVIASSSATDTSHSARRWCRRSSLASASSCVTVAMASDSTEKAGGRWSRPCLQSIKTLRGHTMEVHQLRYFCAIAEPGSFTRAAQKNHVAQPSLSQQIGKLEDELGAKLVERLGRSIRLTEYGRALLPRAQSVLRELESVKLQISEMNGG